MQKIRLSHYKQDRLNEHFVSGSAARTVASVCVVNRKTAAFFFLRLRETVSYEVEAESEGILAASGKANAGAERRAKSNSACI